MRDDDDMALFPLTDIVPDPARTGDIVLLVVAAERALVPVPLGVPVDLGPVEPRLREEGFRDLERGARVAWPAAALLQLRKDDDLNCAVACCGREDGREPEQEGLEGAAEGRDEEDGIGRIALLQRGKEAGIHGRNR